jgi:uncharacterized membrane protein YdfJ with MMPL/SSD domain
VTVLPAVLELLAAHRTGPNPVPAATCGRTAPVSAFWPRIVDGVLRRPAVSCVGRGACSFALAVPALRMHVTKPTIPSLGRSEPALASLAHIRDHFPEQGRAEQSSSTAAL